MICCGIPIPGYIIGDCCLDGCGDIEMEAPGEGKGIVMDPCLIGTPAVDAVKLALTPIACVIVLICPNPFIVCGTIGPCSCGTGENDGLRSTTETGGGVYDGLLSTVVVTCGIGV